MKVLVTGANGQLGYDVCRVLSARGIEHRGVDVCDFDITDSDKVLRFVFSYRPTAIIHCAGYTAVDRAEDEATRCFLINADGTANLAHAAKEVGAKLLYISTDYVFSGEGEHFHEVDEPTEPLSVYGKSKLLGENFVRNTLDRHFIVRISWLFGVGGANFVRTMLELSRTRKDLRVVCDQIGSPTYSLDLARLLCDMIVTERYGTYHATNEGICSWAEFAEQIMRLAGRDTRVNPVPSEEYPTRAIRPRNSRLSKRALTDAGFSPLPDWRDALERYLAELAQQTNQ